MFAVIRHYHFEKSDTAEIDRLIQDEFVPIIRKAQGFVRYYWLDTGAGEGASFGVFKERPAPTSRCGSRPTSYGQRWRNF